MFAPFAWPPMLEGIRTAALMYNPLAGGGGSRRKHDLARAQQILAAAGIDAELQPTSVPGEGGSLAARAVAAGAQMIIGCGGDGTINEIVNGMREAGAEGSVANHVPLAVLPAGTANVLAKELGIPWNIPRAAALIASGVPARVALGRMSLPETSPAFSRYFLCVGGAGPDGALVHALDVSLKLRVGIAAYWLEGVRQLFKYEFPRFRAVVGDRTIEATLAVIGRTRNYGGPFCITAGADLFGDEFEIALFTSQSALRYLSYLPATWMGNLPKLADVHILKTKTLRCEPLASGPVYSQLDGEPAGHLPAHFEVVPDAITLVVPQIIGARLASARGAAEIALSAR
jgi:diacylglycerol kinase family enzyme